MFLVWIMERHDFCLNAILLLMIINLNHAQSTAVPAPGCNFPDSLRRIGFRNQGSIWQFNILTDPLCRASCCSRTDCVACEWQSVLKECSIYTSFSRASFLAIPTSIFYQRLNTTTTTATTTTTKTTMPTTTTTSSTANVNDCISAPCQNGGTCIDGIDAYTCDCRNGYDGAQCQNNEDDCIPNPCQNGGSCADGAASYTCTCATGYGGKECQNSISG